MTNIAQHLPKESLTVAAIFAHYKKVGDSEQARGYLGASIIGHSCERYLWFTFRFCCKPEFSGRMYRLFDTGNLAEARFVKDLRAIGCTVHEADPDTGQQFAVSSLGGHFSGHMDGCALGVPEAPKTWHVTEYKTHSAKSFAKLKKEGVEKSKPQHYAQMQAYLFLTGMTRALYLAVNKDTEELHAERIRYDELYAECIMEKAERIIKATTPPERISQREDWYECSYCDAHAICWGNQGVALPIPAISCRQCCHATPTMDGGAKWVCEKHQRGLSPTDQSKACEDHLTLPGLLSFAEVNSYDHDSKGNDYLEFVNSDGKKWQHGSADGAFSTVELATLPVSSLTNTSVRAAKGLFGATAAGYCADDILHRYPHEDSEIVWQGRASQLTEAWRDIFGEDLTTLTPIAKCDATEYRAAEYTGSRVAVFYPFTKEAEIIKGKE